MDGAIESDGSIDNRSEGLLDGAVESDGFIDSRSEGLLDGAIEVDGTSETLGGFVSNGHPGGSAFAAQLLPRPNLVVK